MAKRFYSFKRRKDDGYGCVNIYAGKIKVAVENHPPYNTGKGNYRIAFYLPEIDCIYGDDQKQLRIQAVIKISEWFEKVNAEPEKDKK